MPGKLGHLYRFVAQWNQVYLNALSKKCIHSETFWIHSPQRFKKLPFWSSEVTFSFDFWDRVLCIPGYSQCSQTWGRVHYSPFFYLPNAEMMGVHHHTGFTGLGIKPSKRSTNVMSPALHIWEYPCKKRVHSLSSRNNCFHLADIGFSKPDSCVLALHIVLLHESRRSSRALLVSCMVLFCICNLDSWNVWFTQACSLGFNF